MNDGTGIQLTGLVRPHLSAGFFLRRFVDQFQYSGIAGVALRIVARGHASQRIGTIRVSARREENTHQAGIPVLDRADQRSFSAIIGDIHPRLTCDQQLRALYEAELGGNHQRRIAISIRGIDSGALADQEAHPTEITPLGNDVHRGFAGCRILGIHDRASRTTQQFGDLGPVSVPYRLQKTVAV